jgi:hypothetical protein
MRALDWGHDTPSAALRSLCGKGKSDALGAKERYQSACNYEKRGAHIQRYHDG